MMNRHSLAVLAFEVGKRLSALGWTVTTAESCTGGGVAHAITAISGSSRWFEQGFVTYSNRSKKEQLGVKNILIESSGAVSGAVAVAMADGALKKTGANIAVAITGIAGPEGGSSEKPVGTVWVAWSIRHGKTFSRLFHFENNRKKVREKAVMAALEGLIELLD